MVVLVTPVLWNNVMFLVWTLLTWRYRLCGRGWGWGSGWGWGWGSLASLEVTIAHTRKLAADTEKVTRKTFHNMSPVCIVYPCNVTVFTSHDLSEVEGCTH